jgi:hypothetical protein
MFEDIEKSKEYKEFTDGIQQKMYVKNKERNIEYSIRNVFEVIFLRTDLLSVQQKMLSHTIKNIHFFFIIFWSQTDTSLGLLLFILFRHFHKKLVQIFYSSFFIFRRYNRTLLKCRF